MEPQTQPPGDDSTDKRVAQPTESSFNAVVKREQLFDEFESAWKSATRPSIETFLGRVSETEREDVLRELLGIELDERLRRGEVPLFAEYRSRFPNDVVTVKAAYCQVMNAPNVTRFQPIDRLGVGGQGEVWRVLDPDLDREVALKVVRPGTDGSTPTPASLAKFKREAEVTGKLEHPCIVPVYEAGSETPEGVPFYVMRILREKSLQVSIDEFHRRDPSPEDYLRGLRGLLDRFIDVCEALGYAHSRGVIHRDLKPVNVMLGDFGETLVVDWGMAKVTGRDELHRSQEGEGTMRIDPDDSKTRDGAIIGTPRYMSPEQARGEIAELKPATDIYGLGAILFAILTGQPPIGPVPRRVTTAPPSPDPAAPKLTLQEILAKVRKGEIPDPTTIDARVPKPLAAICLKALAMEPLERYRQATDTDPQFASLAGDIRRWLNDEPVSAWPEPFTVRAKRWVKNHQTAVTSTAAAILMAMLTLSVMFAIVTGQKTEIAKSLQREQEANQRERDAKELAQQNEQRATAGETLAKANEQRAIAGEADATAAKLRAETNATAASEQSQLALSTLNVVIFDIQRSLENVPGGATVRNRLLTSVLPQLEKVSTQFVGKSAVDRNTFAALIELADTILQLGQSIADAAESGPPRPGTPGRGVGGEGPGVASSAVLTAERLYLRAHEIAKQLAAANEWEAQRDLSISFERLGDVFLKLGRTDDALTRFQDGLTIRRVLAEADPHNVQKQRDLSWSFERLGKVFLVLGRTDDALVQFQAFEKLSRVLAEADSNDAKKQSDLSASFERLGDVFLKLGRTADALTQFQEELKICRMLAEADPNNAQMQGNLASSFWRLGDVLLTLGRTDDALRQFEDNLKICRMLAEADPNNAQMQGNLAGSFERLGDVFLKLGRTADALTQFQSFEKICRVLADADPNDAQKQSDLSWSFSRLGDVFLKLGRDDDALTQFQAYEKHCRLLAEADPNDAQKQVRLSHSFELLGDVFLKLDRKVDAFTQFQECLKIRRTLAEADPNDAEKQRDLSFSFIKLGDAFLTFGYTDAGLAQFQHALRIRRVLAKADPNNAQKQRDLSWSYSRLGNVFLRLGRTDDALVNSRDCLEIRRVLAEADPNNAEKQFDLSQSLELLGDVFLALGRNDDAFAQFQDGLQIVRVLAEAHPHDAQKQRELSISFERLGDVFLKLGRTDDALTQFQAKLKISRVLAEADPNDAQKQRDLSISINKLGDVFLKLGRTDDALTQFQDGLKISRVLAESDPNDAQKQRDLSIAFDRLGDVDAASGRYEAAIQRFNEEIALLDRLIKNKQSVVEATQGKAYPQERIEFCKAAILATGDWDALLKTDAPVLSNLLSIRATELAKRGQLAEVAQAGAKLRDLAETAKPKATGLAALFAGKEARKHDLLYNAACAYGLSATLNMKDKPQATESEKVEQQKHLNLSLACLKEAIAAGYDNFAQMQQEPGFAPLRSLPEFQTLFNQRSQKQLAAAALAIGNWDALLKSDAQVLPNLLSIRATELAKRGQLAEVAQAGAKLRDLATSADPGPASEQKGGMLYNAACAYGLCATLSLKAQPQPTEAEQAERQKWLDLALTCLKEAVTAGFDDFDHIEQDTDLTPLRKLPEFQTLLKQRPQKKP